MHRWLVGMVPFSELASAGYARRLGGGRLARRFLPGSTPACSPQTFTGVGCTGLTSRQSALAPEPKGLPPLSPQDRSGTRRRLTLGASAHVVLVAGAPRMQAWPPGRYGTAVRLVVHTEAVG